LIEKGREYIVDTSDPAFADFIHHRSRHNRCEGVLTGIRKNGERFPIKLSSSILHKDENNSIASIFAVDISENKNQENKLANQLEQSQQLHQKEAFSRMLLESVLDSITDGFFIVDRNWQILFWNKTAETIMGKPKEVLIGKVFWDEFPELEMLKLHEDYTRLFHKNQSIRFREYFPLYKIWADVSAYPSDKSISIYFKDVTEVRNLRILEKLEREVLEMNARPDSSIRQTLDFYLQEIQRLHNGMICSVLRVSNDRLYNWSGPDMPVAFSDAIEGLAIGENVGSCGTAAFRKEKVVVTDIEHDSRWSGYQELALKEGLRACWSFPILDSRNQVMATFAIYYKRVKEPSVEEEQTLERVKNLLSIILENKLSVEAVKSSNQNYDLVALATNDAIWDWDVTSDSINRTGKGMKVLFGYDPEEAAAEKNFWINRIHRDDLARVLEKQAKVMENPYEVYWDDEYRFLRKNGEYAYVFDKGYIIRNEKGKAIRLIGATRDITDRKTNEALLLDLNNRLKHRADELAASNVELERFAYIASHDMQEPLRMITSFLQLFKKKYADQIDETAEQYIHFAVDGADRMKKLILDLLEYSRVGSNKDVLAEINAKELVNEVVNVFVSRIEEMKARIEIGELPIIKANRIQLFQLFQNLIGNALKYHSGESPLIQIQGWEEENEYVFSVKDNGIGIKPIFFEKIFVLFQRLHHKTEYSGTGIGLAICKKIVERHGGKIWLESEPGKGSCFYFSISKSAEQYQ
jgi:PAS domain S-box-containing protein